MIVLRKRRFVVALLAAAIIAFALGPRAQIDSAWREVGLPTDLDRWLADQESRLPDIRAGDQKGIVWADPGTRMRTRYSIVFLHGFSADRHELEPLISDLGRALGANIFFTRLRGHARGPEALAQARAVDWLDDAAEAITVGRAIGEATILVGSSTGGTLAVWGAAQPAARGSLAALVLLSPNLKLEDPRAALLRWPWGRQLARLILGEEHCLGVDEDRGPSALQARHWTVCFPPGVLTEVAALVAHVQDLGDGAVAVPTLAFFSDTDTTIDAAAGRATLARLTAGPLEFESVIPGPGHDGHVLAGDIMAPATTGAVFERTLGFLLATLVSPAAMSD